MSDMKQSEKIEMDIIKFLTGEMEGDEKKRFIQQLESDDSLRMQVEELSQVQSQLGVWENGDITVPEFRPRDNKMNDGVQKEPKPTRKLYLPQWMKYAASFIGLMVLLQISGLKIHQQGNTLMMSFGEPNVDMMSADDVDQLIVRALDKYSEKQNYQFANFKSEMNSDLSQIAASIDAISSGSNMSLADMERMFDKNLDAQYVSLESMIRGIEDNQRQELEDSFTGFMEYIDNRRIKDQSKIQNAFNDIATAINNHQYETNALLTSFTDERPEQVLRSY